MITESKNEQTVEQPQEKMNLSKWVTRFKQSEKIMKAEFKWKYMIAKARLRAEQEIKHRNTKKMTHEQVNLVQSIGNSYVNSVYFKAPNCNLTAREEVDHERIENTEIKVNDWLKDTKIKKTVRRNIWDAYLGGFGARFIDHEYEDVEDQENIVVPGQEAQIDPMSGQMVSEAVPPQFGRIVLKNEIVMHRVRPDLVRFPKGFDFDNYQDSSWIGFDIIHPIDYVKNNQVWDEAVREKVEGEKYSKLSDSEKQQDSDETDADDLYAKISYVFEKPASAMEPFKLLVFCHKYTDAPLQYMDYDKGHIGYPIKFLYHNPLDDDKNYPNGDCWNMESQLSAVDTYWKKMVRHVERSNPKRVYDSGVISQQEAQKLKGNNDNEWVGITNRNKVPIPNLVMDLQAPQVHPDTSLLFQTARQLISEISPKSGLTRGAADAKPDTATEAKIMATGEVIDIEARIDDIRDYIVDIVLDVAGILEKSIEAPMPIRRELPDGSMQFGEVNKDGFTSKINVDVEVESMQAQNKDVYRRQLLDSLQFLTQFEPVMNKPTIDPVTGQLRPGKTLDPQFWLERIMETMNIRNVEKGIVDLPPAPPVLDGQPMMNPPQASQTPDAPEPSESTGAMPPEAIEARLGQMT